MVGLVMLAMAPYAYIYKAHSYGDGVEPGARSLVYTKPALYLLFIRIDIRTGTGRRFFNITMLKHVELADP